MDNAATTSPSPTTVLAVAVMVQVADVCPPAMVIRAGHVDEYLGLLEGKLKFTLKPEAPAAILDATVQTDCWFGESNSSVGVQTRLTIGGGGVYEQLRSASASVLS
ncbi:hypothetical protein D3C72_1861530 [compost metagenome]